MIGLKEIKKVGINGVLVLFILSTVSISLFAKNIGVGAASVVGTSVGVATGSIDGALNGLPKGAAIGTEVGLSAEETTISVKNTVEEIGKLEVLVATIRMKNLHELGDDYKKLYVINADAVFTVDLTQVVYEDKTQTVYIPLPKIMIDMKSREILAETSKGHFSFKPFNDVDGEDGYKGFINSEKEIMTNAKEHIINYEGIFESAKESAMTQVKQLVESLSIEGKTVKVRFLEEETAK